MNDILSIVFIVGVKKERFDLPITRHFSTEVGGIEWESLYEPLLITNFLHFWDYIKERYGVKESTGEITNFADLKATIYQKTRGIDNKGYPWIHTLVVTDKINTEVVEFYPYSLTLHKDIEEEEIINES